MSPQKLKKNGVCEDMQTKIVFSRRTSWLHSHAVLDAAAYQLLYHVERVVRFHLRVSQVVSHAKLVYL
jgi:hypothetical protein